MDWSTLGYLKFRFPFRIVPLSANTTIFTQYHRITSRKFPDIVFECIHDWRRVFFLLQSRDYLQIMDLVNILIHTILLT